MTMSSSKIACRIARCCNGVTSFAGASAAEEPRRGGILNFAVNAEPPNSDCHANTSSAFIHPVAPHWSPLLNFDAPHYPKIIGDLAESWQIAARRPDLPHLQVRFSVKFHDGSAFTSADVKGELRSHHQSAARRHVSIRQCRVRGHTAIETPDPLTVVFKLKARDASMLANFASPWD